MSTETVTIRVRIFGFDDNQQAYPVEATLDDGRVFEGELRLKMEDLLAIQLDVQPYGLMLFEALFAGPIRDAYLIALGRAGEHSEGQLRVQPLAKTTTALSTISMLNGVMARTLSTTTASSSWLSSPARTTGTRTFNNIPIMIIMTRAFTFPFNIFSPRYRVPVFVCCWHLRSRARSERRENERKT
jgi:hypothetical protein